MKLRLFNTILGSLAGFGCWTTTAADLGGTALPPVNASVDCMAALEEAEEFKAIARHLEAGGDQYVILNTQNFNKLLVPWYQKFVSTVQQEQPFGPMNSLMIAGMLMQMEQYVSLSGLGAIKGFGMSEINLGDSANPLYSSRGFVYTGNTPREGFLWDLIGKNQNANALAAQLPGNLLYGGIFSPDFQAFSAKLRTLLPVNTMPPETAQLFKVLDGLSGQITFALMPDAQGKNALLIKMSDKDNLFFNVLAQVMQCDPTAKFTMDSILIQMPAQTANTYSFTQIKLKKGKDSLTLMTAPGLDEFFAAEIAAGRTLANHELFRKYSAGLPEECAILLYSSPQGANALNNFTNQMLQLPDSKNDQSMLEYFTLLNDGVAAHTMMVSNPTILQLEILFNQWGQLLQMMPAMDTDLDQGHLNNNELYFDDDEADADGNPAKEE